MSEEAGRVDGDTVRPGRYGRVERERRFLPAALPAPSAVTAVRVITDRYPTGARPRLRRRALSPCGDMELKLTRTVPAARPGTVQGLVANICLSPAEYEALATLPALAPTKTWFSVPSLGVDVFAGRLRGPVPAEAEFTTDAAPGLPGGGAPA
ncbi:hypothetical protein ACWDZ8_39095 [Streptomyces sp. NPDC003233]